MDRNDVTELIVTKRLSKGLKWSEVADAVGSSKEWVTAACLMDLSREPNPAGDRVRIVMSGKFLAYKTY